MSISTAPQTEKSTGHFPILSHSQIKWRSLSWCLFARLMAEHISRTPVGVSLQMRAAAGEGLSPISSFWGYLRLLGLLTCPSLPVDTQTQGLFPSKEAPNILALVITQESCICYFQKGIFILSLQSLKITSIPHLYIPQKENCSAPSLLKTVLSTAHCFALTYFGFSPTEPSFLRGQGESLNGQDIPNTYLSFHSSLESDKAAVLLASQAWRKPDTESHRQGQKLRFFPPLVATETLMKLHIIPVL